MQTSDHLWQAYRTGGRKVNQVNTCITEAAIFTSVTEKFARAFGPKVNILYLVEISLIKLLIIFFFLCIYHYLHGSYDIKSYQ